MAGARGANPLIPIQTRRAMVRIREPLLACSERGVVWRGALEHLVSQGSALNAVDAKGRVSIPAFLRGVIERRSDARTVVLAKHEAFPCLSAYYLAYAALRARQVRAAAREGRNEPRRTALISAAQSHRLRRHRRSALRQLRPNPRFRRWTRRQGRNLAISPCSSALAETFQIWNPKLLLKDPRIPEDLKDIARFRLGE